MLKMKLLTELVTGPDDLILRYWDSDDGCMEASCAVAVRAFMKSRRILQVREGIRLFFSMHPDRIAALTGLHHFSVSGLGDRLAA